MQFTGVNQEKSELVVKNPSPTRTNARIENHRFDVAILGQLDRRDVLFLGPKNLTSIPMRKTFSNVLLDSLYPKFKNSFGPRLKNSARNGAGRVLKFLFLRIVKILFDFLQLQSTASQKDHDIVLLSL